ncbi:MAG: head-tail adaptor protein [Thermoguttaceae bacterium]|jgi:head-tail adaptor|nr:head-tail adaptor protein [Thermoguttaceae bacterium]
MFDPSDDFPDVIDGLEAVTLVRADGSPGAAVPGALRLATRSREAAACAGHYRASDAVWNLPAAQLPDGPRLGDTIVDAAGQRWTVLEVQLAARGTRWRCAARNLAIAGGLDATIDIEQATSAKGDSGADVPVWTLWRAGVPARIQPIQSHMLAAEGRQLAATRVTIYLAEDVGVSPAHRIRGPDGRIYTIQAVRKASRADALVEIDAVRCE